MIDDPEIGKFVRARCEGRRLGTYWIEGKVREIKRDGAALVVETGWNINLDHGDELIWCGDAPAPVGVR